MQHPAQLPYSHYKSHVPSGVPPIRTPIKRSLVQTLIARNHREHSVFFKKDLHNNFSQNLVTRYALGAEEKRLGEEWELEKELELMPPLQKHTITVDNWRDFLGDKSYYPNFLQFFDEELRTIGRAQAFKKYALNPALFPSLLSGALHPLIQIGVGVEFESDPLTSEGLAEACIQTPTMRPLLDSWAEANLKPRTYREERMGLVEILKNISEDASLDGLVPFEEKNKTSYTIKRASHKIAEYVAQYKIQDNPESISLALTDLYHTALFLFASTGFDPASMNHTFFEHSELKLDFFFLHLLNGAFAIRELAPHLDVSDTKTLLEGYLCAFVMYYIARGRPAFNLHAFENYRLSSPIKNWGAVIELTHKSKDVHLPMLIRTLLKGNDLYGVAATKDAKTGDWFRAATIVTDWIVNQNKSWDFSGCGFDQAWERKPKLEAQ